MNAKTLKEDLQLLKMPVKAKSSRGEKRRKVKRKGKEREGLAGEGLRELFCSKSTNNLFFLL